MEEETQTQEATEEVEKKPSEILKLGEKLIERLKEEIAVVKKVIEKSSETEEEKTNGLSKKVDKIFPKLNQIEQEVSLGTFDNAVLALMIFIVALSLAILSMGVPDSFKDSPALIITFFYIVLLAIPLISAIWSYAYSIFFKRGRFTTKINTITLLIAFLFFLFLNFVATIIILIIESNSFVLPNYSAFIVVGLIIVFVMIYSLRQIKPKIRIFFLEEYPRLILKRVIKMDAEEQKKTLKKLKKTLPELIELAEKY